MSIKIETEKTYTLDHLVSNVRIVGNLDRAGNKTYYFSLNLEKIHPNGLSTNHVIEMEGVYGKTGRFLSLLGSKVIKIEKLEGDDFEKTTLFFAEEEGLEPFIITVNY